MNKERKEIKEERERNKKQGIIPGQIINIYSKIEIIMKKKN